MRETIEKGKKEALIKEGGPLELGITQDTIKWRTWREACQDSD